MKVLFICSALEEGRDGIGDYTRNLAHTCLLNGIEPLLLSVNDEYIADSTSGTTNGIQYFRFPKQMLWKQKETEVQKLLELKGPVDWVSIQFQPYGYSEKGIIKQAATFFGLFKKFKVQVMMHELWVGGEKEAPLKIKILCLLQRWSTLSFLKKVAPRVVNTSIPLYNKMLNMAGVPSTVLPLFSNVQYTVSEPKKHENEIPGIFHNKEKNIVGCLFGSIYHDSWDMSSLFTILKQGASKQNKEVIIVSIGKIGFGAEFWNSLPLTYPDIKFVTLGLREESFISHWLNNYVDIGIVTTPAVIAGKSGSCMAFLEHGVPVVCKQNDMTFDFELDKSMIDDRIIEVAENSAFVLPQKREPKPQLQSTAQQFIKTLNS